MNKPVVKQDGQVWCSWCGDQIVHPEYNDLEEKIIQTHMESNCMFAPYINEYGTLTYESLLDGQYGEIIDNYGEVRTKVLDQQDARTPRAGDLKDRIVALIDKLSIPHMPRKAFSKLIIGSVSDFEENYDSYTGMHNTLHDSITRLEKDGLLLNGLRVYSPVWDSHYRKLILPNHELVEEYAVRHL